MTTIDRTIESVIAQKGDCQIFYHVKDALSDDGTTERLKEWAERLSGHPTVAFSYSSSKDKGMYDAIAESFALPQARAADWLSWINADDYLIDNAVAFIGEIDGVRQIDISWVGGKATMRTRDGEIISSKRPLNSTVIKFGLADGKHLDFVQQEGTFFKRKAWDACVDVEKFRAFRLAGDWYLWSQLAQKYEVYFCSEPLAVFCQTESQLSSDLDTYRSEMEKVIPNEARQQSFNGNAGYNSRISFLYPTEQGIYLRTHVINGYYDHRKQKST